MQTTTARKTIVDVDTRRTVVMTARARTPKDVAVVPHEQFVRNLLKSKMGWPKREPAPEALKVAAREIASVLVQRDKDLAAAKAKARDEAEAKAKKEAAAE